MSVGKCLLSEDGLMDEKQKFAVPIWRFCKNDICLSCPWGRRFNEFVGKTVGRMKRRNLMFLSGFLFVLPKNPSIGSSIQTDRLPMAKYPGKIPAGLETQGYDGKSFIDAGNCFAVRTVGTIKS